MCPPLGEVWDLGEALRKAFIRQNLKGAERIMDRFRPLVCSDLIAASRPDPGPRTRTSKFLTPFSFAFLATSSAAWLAANGVLLREPLNPTVPALDHAITLPITSVMVMMVLLNVA